MKTQVNKAISQYEMIKNNDTIICGVSGGADSMAMIHFLLGIKNQYKLKLVVCHINHELRGDESLRDENFVKEFCEKNSIDFFVKRTDIKKGAKKSRLTIEEYGRRVRYGFFKETAIFFAGLDKNPVKIATAHNLSDVTETMVFHIVRGTGIRGLRAIAPKDEESLEPFVIIRPIILCDRVVIEDYLKKYQVENILDSSNLSDEYSRNIIRSQVLPVFFSINENYNENFFSLKRQADDVLDLLSEEAKKLLEQAEIDVNTNDFKKSEYSVFSKGRTLNTEILKKSHRAILSTAIMFFLERNNIEINEKKIESIMDLIQSRGKINVSKNTFLEVKEEYLVLYQEDKSKDNPYCFKASLGKNKVKMNKTILLNQSKRTSFENFSIINLNKRKNMLDYDIIKDKELILRSRKEKDSIRLFSRGVTKSLKKLYNEQKVPLDRRNDLAVLTVDLEVAWVEGFGVSEKYALKDTTNNVLEIDILHS